MIYKYKCFYSEAELFNFIKDYFISDLQESKSSVSRYDCSSSMFNVDIELKCRRRHYNELIIERAKFDALISISKINSTIPVYVSSTPKGVWAFYLLDHPQIQWEIKDLPRYTDFNRRDNIPKEIGYLNINQGISLLDILPNEI
jgi:hypothetical protein